MSVQIIFKLFITSKRLVKGIYDLWQGSATRTSRSVLISKERERLFYSLIPLSTFLKFVCECEVHMLPERFPTQETTFITFANNVVIRPE